MLLPCPVCSSIGSTKVTWYYSQSEIPTNKLNSTCILKNYKNCSDLKLYWYEYEFKFESVCCSCHIVTHLELSEYFTCRVESTINATVCDSGMPTCTYGQPQTDSQCVAQITTTPVLPSITLSAQSNSTGLAGTSSEPTPISVPSSTNPTGCTLGRVSCHIIYLAAGLGALAVIVMLLVVVVIVLACISVKRGKMKMQGERDCILLCVVVVSKSFLHNYFIVFHLPRY